MIISLQIKVDKVRIIIVGTFESSIQNCQQCSFTSSAINIRKGTLYTMTYIHKIDKKNHRDFDNNSDKAMSKKKAGS